MIRWWMFFEGGYFRDLSASVNSTGKARWQCPRALCTDCRHAISWWSPEGISKMNWSLYGLWWFGNTASGLDRIEELLQQKVWVYVYAIFRVEMRKDVRFWNILKHHATVPELFSSWPFWIARRCTKVANQTSMRTLGGSAEMQQVAESLYGVILSVLVTYWILANLAWLIRNFHKSPRTHRSSALSNRPYDGAPRCRFLCQWFLYRSLGDGSHTKTRPFVNMKYMNPFIHFLVPHPWCQFQFRLFHDVTSPFPWFYLVFVSPYGSLWIYDGITWLPRRPSSPPVNLVSAVADAWQEIRRFVLNDLVTLVRERQTVLTVNGQNQNPKRLRFRPCNSTCRIFRNSLRIGMSYVAKAGDTLKKNTQTKWMKKESPAPIRGESLGLRFVTLFGFGCRLPAFGSRDEPRFRSSDDIQTSINHFLSLIARSLRDRDGRCQKPSVPSKRAGRSRSNTADLGSSWNNKHLEHMYA